MKPAQTEKETRSDDPRFWIGGEATVGSQVHSHIRRQAGPAISLFGVIIGLTFLGGLALGSSFGLLWGNKK